MLATRIFVKTPVPIKVIKIGTKATAGLALIKIMNG
jgi:hypothetical protein